MPPTIEDFDALKLRIGTVTRAEPNTGARDPSYRLWIDLGPDVERRSSAQITDRYSAEDLIGRQVVAVTGFAPLWVGGFRSDVLVLGAITDEGIVLIAPDIEVRPGAEVA